MPTVTSGEDSQPAAAVSVSSSGNNGSTASSSTSTAAVKTTPPKENYGAFAIKVKSEYVMSERPPCLAPLPERAPKAHADDNHNQGDDKKNGNRKRGQNKKRPRDSKINYADKACLAVVRGESCPFLNTDKGCRYNHDLKELLANRPDDITEGEGGAVWLKDGCPFWKLKGCCDFGLMCRLGSCHLNMSTGQNLCRTVDENGKETKGALPSSKDEQPEASNGDDGAKAVEDEAPEKSEPGSSEQPKADGANGDVTMAEPPASNGEPKANGENGGVKAVEDAPKKPNPNPNAILGHHSEIKNVLSKDTQIKLRKNKYPFVCKRHFELQKNKGKKEKDMNKYQPSAPVVKSTATDKPALPPKEPRKLIDFRNKVYIAPLTTVGNLPFRRIMKHYGADITCGEMALADQLLLGKPSEWALLKRHPSEDVFGVQIAAGHADQFTRIAELLTYEQSMEIDFVDLNLGCPIDMVCTKGAGASLMLRDKKLKYSLEGMLNVLNCPVTIKMRTGWNDSQPIAHELQPKIQSWGIDGVAAFMIHGRSRLQRYSRLANWEYISQVACSQKPDLEQIPVIGNGDIFSYTDYEEKILKQVSNGDDGDKKNNLLPTAMLGRGALIKPWLPTEIKEKRHWDISATERLDMLKDFVKFGLEHWGSDQQGVNHTRRFLLEWQSFLHRYVPVGLLEVLPQQMNHRPPNNMCGRSDLETIMMSTNCADWIKISEMLLGPVPEGFLFEPKHKANSYQKA